MGWGAAGRLTCGSGEFCLYGLSLDPGKVSVSVNRCLKERQQQIPFCLAKRYWLEPHCGSAFTQLASTPKAGYCVVLPAGAFLRRFEGTSWFT